MQKNKKFQYPEEALKLYEEIYNKILDLDLDIKPKMDLSNDIFCECKPYAMNAACKVVKKNGPNFGRGFYTCQKRKDTCGFFRWAEEGEVHFKAVSNVKRDCPPTTTTEEPPAKKVKVENGSLDPTSRSYREMACELLYQRLESQEEVMKKSQEVSLEIAKLLAETTKNLKDLFDCVSAIRVVDDVKNSNPFVDNK